MQCIKSMHIMPWLKHIIYITLYNVYIIDAVYSVYIPPLSLYIYSNALRISDLSTPTRPSSHSSHRSLLVDESFASDESFHPFFLLDASFTVWSSILSALPPSPLLSLISCIRYVIYSLSLSILLNLSHSLSLSIPRWSSLPLSTSAYLDIHLIYLLYSLYIIAVLSLSPH